MSKLAARAPCSVVGQGLAWCLAASWYSTCAYYVQETALQSSPRSLQIYWPHVANTYTVPLRRGGMHCGALYHHQVWRRQLDKVPEEAHSRPMSTPTTWKAMRQKAASVSFSPSPGPSPQHFFSALTNVFLVNLFYFTLKSFYTYICTILHNVQMWLSHTY